MVMVVKQPQDSTCKELNKKAIEKTIWGGVVSVDEMAVLQEGGSFKNPRGLS